MTIATILFVCTGNTCRSPMAEGLAQKWIDNHGLSDWLSVSAGTNAVLGHPTSPGTMAALSQRGIKFHGISKPLTSEMVHRAHTIICMSGHHLSAALRLARDPNKVELLDPSGNIADPVGQEQSVYDELATMMEKLISERLEIITRRQE